MLNVVDVIFVLLVHWSLITAGTASLLHHIIESIIANLEDWKASIGLFSMLS